MSETESRKLPRGKFSQRAIMFCEDHPAFTKLYVPAVVTTSLVVQIIAGCN